MNRVTHRITLTAWFITIFPYMNNWNRKPRTGNSGPGGDHYESTGFSSGAFSLVCSVTALNNVPAGFTPAS